MNPKVTILGCGSSGGVPRVGSGWGACDPQEPKNRRRRCSILVEQMGEGGTTSVLVDVGPDLREQLLLAGVTRLDAALITHDHADHTHGIDDIRPMVLHMRRILPVYMDEPTAHALHAKFGYCFTTPEGSSYPPIAREFRIVPGHPIAIDGPGGVLHADAFVLHHGEIDALGFRFGGVAYTPDVKAIPDAALPYLAGLDVWIIDALRITPHPSHFSLSDALGWIARMKPKRAVLTNLHTDLDYATLCTTLPEDVVPAYDGMVIE